MNSKLLISIFIIVFVALVCGIQSKLLCGKVYDGPKTKTDIDRTPYTYKYSVNWHGFHPDHETAQYEVAIISQYQAPKSIRKSHGNEGTTNQRCSSTQRFSGKPDTFPFTLVPPHAHNVYSALNLTMQPGVRYYAVMKITQGNSVVYGFSNGARILNGTGARKHHHHNGGFPAYKAGLIAMGIAIFFLLCCFLLILLLAIAVCGKGKDKYTTTVHRNENVDKL